MTTQELTTEFLENYCKDRLRITTVRGYTVNIQKHLNPELGDVDIALISTEDLDELTGNLREKGLSDRSIVYVHATFRKALNYAKRRQYLLENVYGPELVGSFHQKRFAVFTAHGFKLDRV